MSGFLDLLRVNRRKKQVSFLSEIIEFFFVQDSYFERSEKVIPHLGAMYIQSSFFI